MSVVAPAASLNSEPQLAGPVRPEAMLSPLRFMRAMQANFISVWPDEAYAQPVTQIRVGRSRIFTANAPELIKHVMLDNAENYSKTAVARRLFAPALGQGLLTAEGEVWKRHRQLMAPIFAPRRMAALVPAIVEETERHLLGWRAHAGAAFDLTEAMGALTLDIITRTMFSAESQSETARIADDVGTYQNVLRPSVFDFFGLPQWIPRPGTRKAQVIGDRLTQAIHSMIERRRASGENHDDLLAILLDAVDRGVVSLREIRDEIATIFTAGHETTAVALSWTFYLLDRHPEIEARLRAELAEVLDGRPPRAEDLEILRFTRMVVEESLRLYPPAHTTTRRALGPDVLGDVAIPKGGIIMISPWLTHRNPTLWRDPDRFDPDRFDPANEPDARRRYSFIPFGAGPRICIGASFAMTEAVLVLATILRTWRVRLVADHPVEPMALITMRPRDGLRAVATPRVAH